MRELASATKSIPQVSTIDNRWRRFLGENASLHLPREVLGMDLAGSVGQVHCLLSVRGRAVRGAGLANSQLTAPWALAQGLAAAQLTC
jgi:hypothetical protein